MKDKVSIRVAVEKDAAALVEFNQAMAFETEGKRLDAQILGAGVGAVFQDERKGFYVVAETAAGEIVGGLMITYEWSDWRNKWFWWIQSVYILPDARKRGIYGKLYEFVKARAREKTDVCGFRLYVETENANAQRVYEKQGMNRSHYLMYEQEI